MNFNVNNNAVGIRTSKSSYRADISSQMKLMHFYDLVLHVSIILVVLFSLIRPDLKKKIVRY